MKKDTMQQFFGKLAVKGVKRQVRKHAKYVGGPTYARMKAEGKASEYKVLNRDYLKRSFTLAFRKVTWRRIEVEALERGLSRSSLCESIIVEWLNTNDKVKKSI